jgi:hypothetical protein
MSLKEFVPSQQPTACQIIIIRFVKVFMIGEAYSSASFHQLFLIWWFLLVQPPIAQCFGAHTSAPLRPVLRLVEMFRGNILSRRRNPRMGFAVTT